MIRVLLVVGVISCGPPAPVIDAGAPAACVDVVEARCYCCWPAAIHGPGRCRFARANCAPADPCEADPEQRCIMPDAGLPGL